MADLNAPGWVLVAGEWRWTGPGPRPALRDRAALRWDAGHDDAPVLCRSGHTDCTVDCGWCKGTGIDGQPVIPAKNDATRCDA